MKRILSLALALVMLLGVMVPQTAFAAKSTKNYYLEVTITDLNNGRSVTQRSGSYRSTSALLSYEVVGMVENGYDILHEAFAGTRYWDNIIEPGIDAYYDGLDGGSEWSQYINKYFKDTGFNEAYQEEGYYRDNLVFQTVLGNPYSQLKSLLYAESPTKGKGTIVGYFRTYEEYGGPVIGHTYEVTVSLFDSDQYSAVDLVIIYKQEDAVAMASDDTQKLNSTLLASRSDREDGQIALGQNAKSPLVLANASGLVSDAALQDREGGTVSPSRDSVQLPAVYAADPGKLATKCFRSCINGTNILFTLGENGELVISEYTDGNPDQLVFSEYTIGGFYEDSEWKRELDSISIWNIQSNQTIYALVKGTEPAPTKNVQYYLTFQLPNGKTYTVGAFNKGATVNPADYCKEELIINGVKYKVSYSGPSVEMTEDKIVNVTVVQDTPVELAAEKYVFSYQDVLNGELGTSYILCGPCESGTSYTLGNTPPSEYYPDGYTFGGWYADSELKKPITDKTFTITADKMIYAKWTKSGGGDGGGGTSSVTLTFDVGSGGSVRDQNGATLNQNRMSVSSGTTVNLLNYTGVKEGYTFNGWYADAALTKPLVDIKMDSNKTVYAKWTREVVVTAPIPGMLNGEDHFSYLIGYEDNGIHPNGTITRAEVATIFFRLLKDEVRDQNFTRTNSFNDVKEGSWYNNAISTMAKLNIVNGYADGGFHPNGTITRAEFAAIVSRFDALTNTQSNGFTDIIGHWAEDNINQAANNGWVYGYQDGTFGPNRSISRAETVTLINRVLHRLPATTSDLLDGMKRWPDNSDTSAWYYIAMQEATNSHTYDSRDDGSEKWRELRENRDWSALER